MSEERLKNHGLEWPHLVPTLRVGMHTQRPTSSCA